MKKLSEHQADGTAELLANMADDSIDDVCDAMVERRYEWIATIADPKVRKGWEDFMACFYNGGAYKTDYRPIIEAYRKL